MIFLLQASNDADGMMVDHAILKELLIYSHWEYHEMYLADFFDGKTLKEKRDFPDNFDDAIPLGTINFVTAYLNIFKNIEKMHPIEIPQCLRTEEFLKRKYQIIQGKNIPKSGVYFIKNVSTLKTFSYTGQLNAICNEVDALTGKRPIEDNDWYQLSEVINILSEYRVYFIEGKLYAIAYYDGIQTIFPDINLIIKANLIYSMQKDYPQSYTMDIAITPKGTVLLEIHPLFSCGIYTTVLGTDFLYGYRDSMNYLKKHNHPIIP